MGVVKQGHTTKTKLTNQGNLEYYRCLCCCVKFIPLYEQVLYHSTRREHKALNAVSIAACDSRFLHIIFETSVAFDDHSRSLLSRVDTVIQCTYKLSLVVGGNNDIQSSGLQVQHDDTHPPSYIQ